MKTPLEILEETIKYYSEDVRRRASVVDDYGGLACKYLTEDGRMCAVGRCLNEELSDMSWEGSIHKELITGNILVFKEEYDLVKVGYHIDDVDRFWQKLQSLHDISSYWDDKGLTHNGHIEVNNIKEYVQSIEHEI